MQFQKDDIRNQITHAALKEFSIYGFKRASMRTIASEAGITVGSIYTYFSSKEDLFNALLSKPVEIMRSTILTELPDKNTVTRDALKYFMDEVAKNFFHIRKHITILIYGSKGTNFEKVKEELVQLAAKRITDEFPTKLDLVKSNPIVAESVAIAMIDGIINIIIKCDRNVQQLSESLSEYMCFIIGDLFM